MPHYHYLIVGGGSAASSAVSGIRKNDPNSSIGLLSGEPVSPYDRSALSTELWNGKPMDQIWRPLGDLDVDVRLAEPAVQLNIAHRTVTGASGEQYGYQKLLLATGGEPKPFPFHGDSIFYLHTLADYQHLRERAVRGSRMVLIGGGFIGTELAAALTHQGCQITLIMPGEGLSARLLPPDLARFLVDYYRRKGVKVYPCERVLSIEQRLNGTLLVTHSRKELWADTVVIAIGIEPSVELAAAAGIKVASQSPGGILVDSRFSTNALGVYAAGDVASVFHPIFGGRMRFEHGDSARRMGEAAGRSMSGEPVHYDDLPVFSSRLFDLGYEAVGDLNPRCEIYADWQDPFHQGVVYYLRNKRVRGVLLWNVWNQVSAARRLIAEPGPISPRDLQGRLPETQKECNRDEPPIDPSPDCRCP